MAGGDPMSFAPSDLPSELAFIEKRCHKAFLNSLKRAEKKYFSTSNKVCIGIYAASRGYGGILESVFF
jgi:hypothetical protein